MSASTIPLPLFIMLLDQTTISFRLFDQALSFLLVPQVPPAALWEISVSMGITHLTSSMHSFFVLLALVTVTTTPISVTRLCYDCTGTSHHSASLISQRVVSFSFNDFPIQPGSWSTTLVVLHPWLRSPITASADATSALYQLNCPPPGCRVLLEKAH